MTDTTATHTWKITAHTQYHSAEARRLRGGEGWDTVRTDTFTGDGPSLEDYVKDFVADVVIGVDDERFDGPGTPISTEIRIDWQAPER